MEMDCGESGVKIEKPNDGGSEMKKNCINEILEQDTKLQEVKPAKKKQRIDTKLDTFPEEDEKLELSEKRLENVKEIPDDLKLKLEERRQRFSEGVYGLKRAMYERDSTYPYGDYVVQSVQGYAKMAIDVFNKNQNESMKYSVVDVIRADRLEDSVFCVLFTAKLDDDDAKKFKARITRRLDQHTELMDVEEIPDEVNPYEMIFKLKAETMKARNKLIHYLLHGDFGCYWPIYERDSTYNDPSTVQLVKGYANMAIDAFNQKKQNQNQSSKYRVVDVIRAVKIEDNVVYVLFTAKHDVDAKHFYANIHNTGQHTVRTEVMDVDFSAT